MGLFCAVVRKTSLNRQERDMKRGKFIVLEGIDGSGKTTQARLIEERLNEMGVKSLVTREPGGTELGEKLRTFAFANKFPATLDACLMFSSRLLHLTQLIRPTLDSGTWVICDRFISSSWAYQSTCPRELLSQLENSLIESNLPVPDLEIFLSLNLETATSRRRVRSGESSRFEENLEDAQNAYEQRYLKHHPVWPVEFVDAGRGICQLTDILITEILELNNE